MTDDLLQYDQMVENAYRSVVRESLLQITEHGFPGNHHFYITFHTGHGDVNIPTHLKRQHPQEMTIVLEHQFWGLEVEDEFFEVTLGFNKTHERLHIPFAAVTGFADPSAKFGLQMISNEEPEPIPMKIKDNGAQNVKNGGDGGGTAPEAGGEVVTLDAFRGRPGKN